MPTRISRTDAGSTLAAARRHALVALLVAFAPSCTQDVGQPPAESPVAGQADALHAGGQVVDIGAGNSHVCALSPEGEVKCFGYNVYGQLGNNSTTDSWAPTNVLDLVDATSIGVGDFHSCAIHDGGKAVCWGLNGSGRLGNGYTTNQDRPAQVSGLTNAAWIDAGAAHSCAATTTGSAKCWGSNGSGRVTIPRQSRGHSQREPLKAAV